MFIRTYHPKKSLRPDKSTIEKMLGMGWVAQAKMNGFRVQIHVTEERVVNYTRQGSLHTRPLPKALIDALKATFEPGTAIIGEWVQHEGKIYLFDCIKKDGETLSRLSYKDRFALLPDVSGPLTLLPFISDVETAYQTLMDETTEGIVFKDIDRKGFEDNSIIRCRRCGVNYQPLRNHRSVT